MLTTSAYFPLIDDLTICRLLNGLWQISGAHGRIDPATAIANMFDYHDAGFTTWDLADHYGPAEDFIGNFRQQLARRDGESVLQQIQAFTKWVPRPGRMIRQTVESAIDLSRNRMNVDSLDLLQFHWWQYDDRSYLDALKHLADLQQEGKIRHLALTNFSESQI
jgi:aryl-alcohol dehydrogenase-like predicted oxidoreductase